MTAATPAWVGCPPAQPSGAWVTSTPRSREKAALAAGQALDSFAERHLQAPNLPYAALLTSGRMLPPLTHPDPARCLVSGTGLTHYGSASARDAMHQKLAANAGSLTDTMQMFKWGVEGGRPENGQPGAQPEWFYKGTGEIVHGCGSPLPSPSFALDGGEEPEIVGLYLIGADGTAHRLGFAIGTSSAITSPSARLTVFAHSKCGTARGPGMRTLHPRRTCRASDTPRRAVALGASFCQGENTCAFYRQPRISTSTYRHIAAR